MSRAPESSLSGLQLAVMRVLWQRGEARVADVHAALASERGLAATTAATLLTRLEKRGLVAHRTEGRQHVYRALKTQAQVSSSMVQALTEDLFKGDTLELVAHLLREREVAAGDLARIRRMIEEKERGL